MMWTLVFLSIFVTSQALVVNIPGLGDVEGVTSTTAWTARTIHEFRGIRYAKSPSGELRFRDPVKFEPWQGIYDATIFGQACPQPKLFGRDPRMQNINKWYDPHPEVLRMQQESALRADDPEDCLTLNVYTPMVDPTEKFPVLFYIHGGAFLYGTAGNHLPTYILEKDIVLVTPQYRLAAFGFLHMNTAEAPGNMALSDQLMALHWVHDNIEVFGGDPKRITIGGLSAGSASVGLHLISPRSQGLFIQAIEESGSNLDIWAMEETDGEIHSREVATIAGCDGNASPEELTACLRAKPVDAIVNAQLIHALHDWSIGGLGMGSAMPSLQREAPGVDPFISELPRVTMEAGTYNHVPLIIGATKHEGIYFLDFVYQFFLTPNNYIKDKDFLRYDFVSLLTLLFGATDASRLIEDACLSRYLNPQDMGNFTAMTPGLVDMFGAFMIKAAALRQTELHSQRAKTYLYSFDYQGSQSLVNTGEGALPVPGGVTHGDDTMYLFPRSAEPLNEKDTLVAQSMVEMFANFVINGTPSASNGPAWPEFTSEDGMYLSIGETNVPKHDFTDTYSIAREQGLTPDI